MNSLIYLKGVDKTKEIHSIVKEGKYYDVVFKKNLEKKYPYSLENVKIEELCHDETVLSLFNKFKTIAKSTKVVDSEYSALGRYYNNIVLKQDSILTKYLSREPLKKFKYNEALIFPFSFNLSQFKAAQSAFENELSVIQGPPGTGKTQTILNIVMNAVVHGKNIAIVSNNNAAVDNVRDKLINAGYEGLFAELGSMAKQEAFFSSEKNKILPENLVKLDECQLNNITESMKRSTEKLKKLMEVELETKKVEEDLSLLRKEKEHYDNFFHTHQVDDSKKYTLFNQNLEGLVDFIVDNEVTLGNDQKLNLISKLRMFFKYSFFNFKELTYNEHEVIMNYYKKFYELKEKNYIKVINKNDKILKDNKFDDVKSEHKDISLKVLNHYLAVHFNEKRDNFSIKDYKKNYDEFIESYPIILSTTYSIMNCCPKGYKFDLVVVDEASTVDIVKGILPLVCGKQVIIVGDEKQLPHIPIQVNCCFSDSSYDYKTHSILTSILNVYGDEVSKTLLKEHYRCHPEIIRFCNKKFYNGDLVVYSSSKTNKPLQVIKTSKGNHSRQSDFGNKGVINRRELEETDVFIDEVAAKSFMLQQRDEMKYNIISKDDIGFIAPFRKQVTESTQVFSRSIESDTVHKFQGREKEMIIYSTVLDQSGKSNKLMSFATRAELVNVAVSRAKSHLVVVSDLDAFSKPGNNVGDLIRYIEYQDLANIKQGELVSAFDLLYKSYSHKLLKRREKLDEISNLDMYTSEKIVYTLLNECLNYDKFQSLDFASQIRLKNIFADTSKCNEREKKFINNRSSVDFLIYSKFDKSPLLGIEVDGYAFHENNPNQLERDNVKNNIFMKYGLPLVRYRTDAILTEKILEKDLESIL